jgi:hypothetical protein
MQLGNGLQNTQMHSGCTGPGSAWDRQLVPGSSATLKEEYFSVGYLVAVSAKNSKKRGRWWCSGDILNALSEDEILYFNKRKFYVHLQRDRETRFGLTGLSLERVRQRFIIFILSFQYFIDVLSS